MSNSLRLFCCVGLAVACLATTAFAQEKGQGRRPGGAGGFGMRDPFQLPEALKVTDEQKAKIAELQKKYGDKVKAANEKAKLTEEQQGKMRDVFTKFQATGKERSEFAAFMAEELKLSDAQKKGREEQTALIAEITKEIQGVLTEEQKKQLTELRAQRRPGGNQGKRLEQKKSE